MANRYGEAAIIAARQGAAFEMNPVACWEEAVAKLYPTSQSAQRKGGPRGAFLGLCEEGLVKGIPPGHYKATRENKTYAVRAATVLIEATTQLSRSVLWRAVTNGADISENSQIDVVLALWKNGLIAPQTQAPLAAETAI